MGPWFIDLQDRAFIRMTQAPHLGPAGIGQTSQWALEELPTADLKGATKGFMAWGKNKIPAQKTGHPVTNTVRVMAVKGPKLSYPS